MTDQDKLSLTQFLQAKSYRLDGRGVHIDIDAFVSFLDMFKPSDIVYPQVVVRNFGVSRVYAAKLLDLCAEYGVVQKVYEVYCPHCQRDSGNMFASKKNYPLPLYVDSTNVKRLSRLACKRGGDVL